MVRKCLLLIAPLVLALAACDERDSTTQATSPTPPITTSPTPPPTSPSPSVATPTAALCDPEVMLPVIHEQVEIAAPLTFGAVEIQECQNGYARVYAKVADPPPGTEDAEQVFLRDAGGTWEVITSGTGITCEDEPVLPILVDACRALGSG